MNIPVVIEALKEFSDWLDGSKSNQERVNRIIGELLSEYGNDDAVFSRFYFGFQFSFFKF